MAARIPDDQDIVRALGFVTMYSAWLEQDVDDVLDVLGETRKGWLRWPVSRKVKEALKKARSNDSQSSVALEQALLQAQRLFERRNVIVHGRIFGDHERDLLKSGRENGPTREVTFEEVRDLANSLFDARDGLLRVSLFGLSP